MKEPCFPAEGGGCWVCFMEGGVCTYPENQQEIDRLATQMLRAGIVNPSPDDIAKAAIHSDGSGSFLHNLAIAKHKQIRAAFDRIQREVGGQQSLF